MIFFTCCLILHTFYVFGPLPAFLNIGNLRSEIISSSTGAPQGTVLAPFLFSMYTSSASCPLVKFADDTSMVGLITNDYDTEYRQEIMSFIQYCKEDHLVLNVSKTKKMLIDFRINSIDLIWCLYMVVKSRGFQNIWVA